MKTIDEKTNVLQILDINGQIEELGGGFMNEERAGRAETACRDRRLLARKYALYARAYSEAVDKLVSSSQATRSEWDLAWDLENRARLLCKRTLDQLQAHTGDHGC